MTDGYLRSLQRPRDERDEVGDTGCPGLRVRAGKTGVVSFIHYTTEADGRRVVTLGHFPALGLTEARKKCQEAKAAHKAGTLEAFLQPPAGIMPMSDLVDVFVRHLEGRRRRPERARALLDLHVVTVRFCGHAVSLAGRPFRQTVPTGRMTPHAPQFSGSLAVLTPVPPWPPGQTVSPPLHVAEIGGSAPPHAAPRIGPGLAFLRREIEL